MHQVKFVVTDCAGGDVRLSNATSMMGKTLSGCAPHSSHAIHWAVIAASVGQCQETFCAKLLSAYKYLA